MIMGRAPRAEVFEHLGSVHDRELDAVKRSPEAACLHMGVCMRTGMCMHGHVKVSPEAACLLLELGMCMYAYAHACVRAYACACLLLELSV